nr:histone-like nucleoid-structuring protein Lsr2 [Kocuria oceani]
MSSPVDAGSGSRERASGSNPDTAKIRAWAKENGHEVSDRGRIHQTVKNAYYAAH